MRALPLQLLAHSAPLHQDLSRMSSLSSLPPHDARAHLVGLLLASGEGNESAFAELYRLTSAKLFGIIIRICDDSGMAEDVLVDVYLTIWRRAGAYEPGRASPITWMATIARNRAIDFLRRVPKVPRAEIAEAEQVADEAPLAEARMLAAEEGQQLHLCLDALELPQANAIRRAFFDGLIPKSAGVDSREGFPGC